MKKAVLLSLLSLALSTSCLQRPDSMNNDNGPEANPEDVQKALITAMGATDQTSLLMNEFMYLEQEQHISNFDSRIVYKESTQVINKVDSGTDITYSLLNRSTAIDPTTGNFKPVTSTEQSIAVAKVAPSAPGPGTPSSAASLPTSVDSLQKSMAEGSVGLYSDELHEHFLGIQTFMNMLAACQKTPTWDVTCHNLQVSEGLMPVPDLIAQKPNCGGFSNCQLHFKKVGFDLVVRLPDPSTNTISEQKVIYTMTFSEDVPFLSRVMEFCYEGLVSTSNQQKIPVTVCNRVRDFERGQNSP